MIEIEQVSKRYGADSGSSSLAVSDATLTAVQSEFIALVGPSGCGKTTLLKIAAGRLDASDGSVRFDGRPGSPPPKDMGLVFDPSASVQKIRRVGA